MTSGSSLFFAGKDWLVPALFAFVLALVVVATGYLRTVGPRSLRLGCAALKLLGFAALIACLLEPTWSAQRAKPGANVVAIVADNSLSMKLRGRGDAQRRGEAMQQSLRGEPDVWRTRLAENFGVRNYFADSRLQATEDFRELDFAGRSSALVGALKTLSERYRAQPLAGVILLTDGVASDLQEAELATLPPVYPVVFGSDDSPRDLAITSTGVTQTSFEDAPVTVQADVGTIGFVGEEVLAKIFAVEEAPVVSASAAASVAPLRLVAEQTMTARREGEKLVFRFQLRPEKTGVLFYQLRVAAKGEWDAPAGMSNEATLANNQTVVTVDRGSDKQRVLYVGGRPNWEYKFLSRALAADAQTELVGLIRIAKREAKFEFRGRSGESSNPLFRGFENQSKEEIERYDQPVLLRLNTQDELELSAGFPKTAEELFKYRAVIVDDLEAEFFTAEQMMLLQRFVSERGGGFLMLGGAESFAEGKYGRTPVGEMLPIYLRAPETAREGENPQLQLSFTREGSLQPWARLRQSEAEEKARLAGQPHFDVLNRARETKPAAMVLATITDGRETFPALVTQRFGRGRSAALLVGDWWKSGLGDEARQKDLGRAWRQMIRWLVADVPGQIELRAETQAGKDSVRLQVRARNVKFEPLDNARVTLKVQPVSHDFGAGDQGSAPGNGSEPVSLTAEASPSEPGLYEATFIPRDSGGYRVEAAVSDENGGAAGTAQGGWNTDLAAAEFKTLTPNRAAMEMLAQKTGGQVLSPEQLDRFARELPSKGGPVTETWTQPLWHTPAVFLMALTCFVAEWGLRRWKGLA